MSYLSGLLASLVRCRRIALAGGLLVSASASVPIVGNRPLPLEEKNIELPPFLVSERANWRYLGGPGFEILSLCDDEVTIELARGEQRLNHLLDAVLPEKIRIKRDVPTLIIAYTQSQQASSQDAVMKMLRSRGELKDSSDLKVQVMPNLRLWDKDLMVVLALLPDQVFRSEGFNRAPLSEQGFKSEGLTHAVGYIGFVAKNRTPPLPAWFIQGLLILAPKMNFAGNAAMLPPAEWVPSEWTKTLVTGELKGRLLTLKELDSLEDPIIYEKDSMVIRAFPPKLIPFDQFFNDAPPTDSDGALLWRAQSALFVRWMLDPKAHNGPSHFQEFLDRSSRARVTETDFRDCFGADFVTTQMAMNVYLRVSLHQPLALSPRTPAPPEYTLHPRQATKTEIARIKGELERLEANSVRTRFPEFAEKYLEQSLRTLSQSSIADTRDPRLLAALGLSQVDAGQGAAARKSLEAAAQAGVIRPRVYCELARLRLAEARSRPLGDGGKLSAAQTAAVLEPLFTARKQQPQLAEVYTLIAETWSSSAFPSTRRELAVLDEGVRLFPGDTALIFSVASVHAQRGYETEAANLAEFGQKIAGGDETARLRFTQLLATLHNTAPRAPAP